MDPKLTHNLLKYSSEAQKQAVLESLVLNTTSLKQLLQKNLVNDEVNQWFLEGFKKTFPGNWNKGKLTSEESSLIENLKII